MSDPPSHAPGSGAAYLRIGLYVLCLAIPLGMSLATSPETGHPLVQEVSKSFALVGFTMLALQFVIAARLDWIERPFGLDAVFHFHKRVGILASILLVGHPILYATEHAWPMLRPFAQPWPIALGQLGFVLILLLSVGSALRRLLALEFETWRAVHNALAIAVLGLGFVHSWYAGGDFTNWPMRLLWLVLVAVPMIIYVRHKVVLPARVRRYVSEVVDVIEETPDVHTLVIRPPHPSQAMRYLPGQFAFLTLFREGMPVEEHPFTISSSPARLPNLTVTIKASGDYTATVGYTRKGDRAAVRGPFGRFSYVLWPSERDLVFVAGGVGVTPMLSMLRHMRDVGAECRVLLIYANRTETDIVARAELESMVAGGALELEVVHVLSCPGDAWAGERGRVSAEFILDRAGGVSDKTFYISGPPQMISDLCKGLSRAGVAASAIRTERFEL